MYPTNKYKFTTSPIFTFLYSICKIIVDIGIRARSLARSCCYSFAGKSKPNNRGSHTVRYRTMADTVADSRNNSNTAAVQATNDDASASKL